VPTIDGMTPGEYRDKLAKESRKHAARPGRRPSRRH
jgi:hypothetical protein